VILVSSIHYERYTEVRPCPKALDCPCNPERFRLARTARVPIRRSRRASRLRLGHAPAVAYAAFVMTPPTRAECDAA